MSRFYQEYVGEVIAVENNIIKVKPYLYATKRAKDGGLHNPECQVKVKADIWMCVGAGAGSRGYYSKVVNTKYYPRCDVDIENKQISKNGNPIQCNNIDAVLEIIRAALIEAGAQ